MRGCRCTVQNARMPLYTTKCADAAAQYKMRICCCTVQKPTMRRCRCKELLTWTASSFSLWSFSMRNLHFFSSLSCEQSHVIITASAVSSSQKQIYNRPIASEASSRQNSSVSSTELKSKFRRRIILHYSSSPWPPDLPVNIFCHTRFRARLDTWSLLFDSELLSNISANTMPFSIIFQISPRIQCLFRYYFVRGPQGLFSKKRGLKKDMWHNLFQKQTSMLDK